MYVQTSVARWYIFKPKIQIWVNFRKALQWKMLVFFMAMLSTFRQNGIFLLSGTSCGHSVCFSTFWYVVPRKIWHPRRRHTTETSGPCQYHSYDTPSYPLLHTYKHSGLEFSEHTIFYIQMVFSNF
jgi:hypothetical protein